MLVASLLPKPLLTQLEIALRPDHSVIAASCFEGLDYIARRHTAEAAVIDPSTAGSASVEEIVAFHSRHPSIPVTLYVALSPTTLRDVVSLAKQGFFQVVLHRFDDEPWQLRDVLLQRGSDDVTDQVLGALSAPLAQLPATLARVLREMMRQPHLHETGEALARAARMSRRTMYRHLAAAGFAPAAAIIRSARVLRAYIYLQDPGNMVQDVRAKLHYPTSRAFAKHTRKTTGLNPSIMRQRMEHDEFATILVRQILSGEVAVAREQRTGA